MQWHGEKRSNDTHASTTDPEARLYRKSHNTAATLCYSGHLLMENRNALIVDAELTTADGYAERATALEMLARLPTTARRRTVAGDKGYDTRGFIAEARELGFTPHVAQNTTRQRSAIDGRTTRHAGHAVSMRIRKRIEEPFGWIKTIGGGRKLRYIGRERNRAWFKITAAVYNLIRITALDTTTRLTEPSTGAQPGSRAQRATRPATRPDATASRPTPTGGLQDALFSILLTPPWPAPSPRPGPATSRLRALSAHPDAAASSTTSTNGRRATRWCLPSPR